MLVSRIPRKLLHFTDVFDYAYVDVDILQQLLLRSWMNWPPLYNQTLYVISAEMYST